MNKRHILVIEDDRAIARALDLELTHEGYAVIVAHDGREGLDIASEKSCDLILLDIMLPEISGVEVCRRLRQFTSVPEIMLTAKDSIMDKVVGLDCGANDYVTKPYAIEELLARIRASLRGRPQTARSAETLSVGNIVLETSTYRVWRGTEAVELTRREFELLEYLMRNPGIVLTREQLSQAVWGYNYLGNTNIVDVYIRYLRSKIEDEGGARLIQTVRGVGYMLSEDE
ncbi:MAG: response regulator transcription factor [Candidatus Saccharibacteria bacterium]